MTHRRCAIYTRKSTEEGLDQAFTSLDAQREACAAYVASQRHEGWRANPGSFDDPGFSGGSMQRPGLARLLAAVSAGRIDVVVVYKVDRLTRSLTDFARIVEIFDAAGVSFVSVTQQFNTTTSMGRLTLNVLLSFAQFEREVAAERIRDKIAASKRKGLWTGGVPPLGYDVRDRALVVNVDEARIVRAIFEAYLRVGSVRALKADLDARAIVSKRRLSRAGRASGGRPFTRGALYALLRNPLYVGEVAHGSTRHPGRHSAILDRGLWQAVQDRLAAASGGGPKHRGAAGRSDPLDGLLFDECGRAMRATSASRRVAGGRRIYRYLASRREPGDARPVRRLPAGALEALVRRTLVDQLGDGQRLGPALRDLGIPPGDLGRALEAGASLAHRLDAGKPDLREVLARAELGDGRLVLTLRRDALPGLDAPSAPLVLEGALAPSQAGRSKPIVLGVDADGPARDPDLIALVADARRWSGMLLSGEVETVEAITRGEGLGKGVVSRVLPLAHLAPDIAAAILEGRQPRDLTARRLRALPELPIDWDEQRALLGFPPV